MSEELTVPHSRASRVRKKQEPPPVAGKPWENREQLQPLDEAKFAELTNALKSARHQAERMNTGYGRITKDLEKLWESCAHMVGGDIEALRDVSLSQALLTVYGDAEAVDHYCGVGVFKESRSNIGGAASWRKPWAAIKRKMLPARPPAPKDQDSDVEVATSPEAIIRRDALDRIEAELRTAKSEGITRRDVLRSVANIFGR